MSKKGDMRKMCVADMVYKNGDVKKTCGHCSA